MKGKLYTVLVVLLLLVGSGILLYPTVSDAWNARLQAEAIRQYAQEVELLETERHRELLETAKEYNAALADRADGFSLPEDLAQRYATVLSAGEDGILAYVEIPSLSVMLPIARGTDEKTLQKYVGHLEWTYLPIGGESTHSVISAHRGLPSAELFTHIDRLQPGDRFYIHVLGETLEYKVDNIAVVEPQDTTLLGMVPGQDYVTLLTCTPYGINSHRLLVRGTRVAREAGTEAEVTVPVETGPDFMLLIPAVVALIAAAVVIFLILDSRKGKGGKYETK